MYVYIYIYIHINNNNNNSNNNNYYLLFDYYKHTHVSPAAGPQGPVGVPPVPLGHGAGAWGDKP